MKEKLSIYLDTAVLSFCFADDSPKERDITKEFFEEMRKDRIQTFISEIVVGEINNAPEPKKSKLLNLINKYNLRVLPLDQECEDLADRYVKHKIIPLRYRDDAVHIAIAIINRVDVIISWNLKHMVKLRTIHAVNSINKESGYKEIDIRTAEEVLP